MLKFHSFLILLFFFQGKHTLPKTYATSAFLKIVIE